MTSFSASAIETKHHRVSQLAILINGFPFDSADFSTEGDVPLVRIRDLSSPDYETFVPREKVPAFAFVRNGDVVIGMDGDFNSVLWTRGEAALNQRVCLLRVRPGVDPRYLAYAIPPHLQSINDLTWSTTVKHLSAGSVRAIRVPAHSAAQQRAIADYLDRETARIDAFIAKNEELITLLTERRASEISSTLAGEWPLVQLRALSEVPIQNGVDAVGDPGNPAEWPRYVRTTDMATVTSLYPDKRVTIAPESAASARIVRDDLLLTRAGATIGKSYLHSTEEVAAYAGYLVRVRPDKRRVLPAYLAYWTLSKQYLDQIRSGAVVSTIENFSASKYRALRVPLPPLYEQVRIIEQLESSSAASDRAMQLAQVAIGLARERRAALISAAVTGKIDVGVAA